MQSVKPVSEKYKKRKIASQVTKIMAEVEKGLDTDITTVGQSSNIVSEVAFESNSNTETENSSHVISNSMSLPVIANADAYNETDLIKTDDWLENTEWKSRTLNEMSFDDEADESDNLFNSLSNWAVSYNISLAALSSLLSILHSFIPNLPKDARTLLRTQRHVELLKISGDIELEARDKCKLADQTSNIDQAHGKRPRNEYEDDGDCSSESDADENVKLMRYRQKDGIKRKADKSTFRPLPTPTSAPTRSCSSMLSATEETSCAPVLMPRVERTPLSSLHRILSVPSFKPEVELALNYYSVQSINEQTSSVPASVPASQPRVECTPSTPATRPHAEDEQKLSSTDTRYQQPSDTCTTPTATNAGTFGMMCCVMQQVVTSLQEIKQTQMLHSTMLQSLSRKLNATNAVASAQIPSGLSFPIRTLEELAKTEDMLTDAANKQIMITVLVENGGDNITEFVKRNMRFMLGDDLARKFNLTGQKGKRSFAKLVLFDILFMALKSNVLTRSCSKKNVEDELSNWFGNARDRGNGRRPLAIRQQNTSSATAAATAEENV